MLDASMAEQEEWQTNLKEGGIKVTRTKLNKGRWWWQANEVYNEVSRDTLSAQAAFDKAKDHNKLLEMYSEANCHRNCTGGFSLQS